MKKILLLSLVVVAFVGCTNTEEQLRQRAAELCRYIPDHQLNPQSRNFLTADFYAVLDTMFNHLPEFEAMDHEWLYYFVTGNGGSMADYEVLGVEQTDATHAVATISVRQVWEDGSFDPNTDVEEHQLSMEKVDGQWLMSDFDGHKADCRRHIAISHREQAMRNAVGQYLVSAIGANYLQGERCVPQLTIIHSDALDADTCRVWGDFWVFWYNLSDDTLKTVSGGNHAGCFTLLQQNGRFHVLKFDQTVDGAGNVASAKRIFGQYFDQYQNCQSNADMREAVRAHQLAQYVKDNGLTVRFYQDYGWPAKPLTEL